MLGVLCVEDGAAAHILPRAVLVRVTLRNVCRFCGSTLLGVSICSELLLSVAAILAVAFQTAFWLFRHHVNACHRLAHYRTFLQVLKGSALSVIVERVTGTTGEAVYLYTSLTGSTFS